MPRSRRLLAPVPALPDHGRARRLTSLPAARLAPLALVALLAAVASVASPAAAQGRALSGTLHVATSRFEFVAAGDSVPTPKPLVVHNGGAARLTDVRLTRLAYADSARGAAWLVVLPRQSAVAPNELATVGTLCVDASGLEPGTYRATAAVGAREVAEPVAVSITLVVRDAGAHAHRAAARCAAAVVRPPAHS